MSEIDLDRVSLQAGALREALPPGTKIVIQPPHGTTIKTGGMELPDRVRIENQAPTPSGLGGFWTGQKPTP